MRNPASVYCVEDKGGQLEIVRLPSGGEVGICTLPDGEIVEEWTLYRRDKGLMDHIRPELRDEIQAAIEEIRNR